MAVAVKGTFCLFCKEIVPNPNYHEPMECPICRKTFSCAEKWVWIGDHFNSNECTAQWCENCKVVSDGTHYKTCGCGIKYICTGTCPGEHCQKCLKGFAQCHCDGPCVDPAHDCEEYQFHKPQHSTETLKRFGMWNKQKNEAYNIATVARSFYGALILGQQTGRKDVKDKIVHEIAEHLNDAILLACAGEMRSTVSSSMKGIQKGVAYYRNARGMKDIPSIHFGHKWIYTRPFGMNNYAARCMDEGVGNRHASANVFYEEVVDKFGKAHALRILANHFEWQGIYTGGGGYGGPLWSQAARLGYNWTRGRISDVAFVDMALDLHHNGGVLFTKTHKIPAYFEAWLNARVEADAEWIIDWTPNAIRKAFGHEEREFDRKLGGKDISKFKGQKKVLQSFTSKFLQYKAKAKEKGAGPTTEGGVNIIFAEELKKQAMHEMIKQKQYESWKKVQEGILDFA